MDARLNRVVENALIKGQSQASICKIALKKHHKANKFKYNTQPVNWWKSGVLVGVIVVLLAVRSPEIYKDSLEFFTMFWRAYVYDGTDRCLIGQTSTTIVLTRPLQNCSFCNHFTKIPVLRNLTREYFLAHHAYTAVPVLIKNAASHWLALRSFSFEFFQEIYNKTDAHDENLERGCQFFPYKTNFNSLKSVFQMSKKRSQLRLDQWYVGWSNCVPRVMRVLRRFYERPSFLPSDSESSQLDWLFMGGSGMGAEMHIDSVNRPSWQAMISGRKTWYLEPSPECESVCSRHLQVTMETGDILVVDTNRWYHSTFVHKGQLSITIGSEFD